MSNVEQQSSLPLGLDVGTSRIVVARSMDKSDQTQYESQLNAFITMPYSKLAESLLAREGVFHEVFDGELVVTGNDAQTICRGLPRGDAAAHAARRAEPP